MQEGSLFYVCSFSQLLVYKGMLTPEQVFQFFDDLNDQPMKLTWRWSTRGSVLIHFGIERSLVVLAQWWINTLLGNVNAMNARGNTHSEFFANNINYSQLLSRTALILGLR